MKLNEISIEILQKCPNRCIYCSSHSNPLASNMIPFEVITRIVDDAKVLGCKTVCLSGGEPFLHPYILDIIEYIAKQQMDCFVYTSGIFSKNDHYSSLPNEYLEYIRGMVTKLIFNVEADTPELYDFIMGTNVGGFELMKESIFNSISCGFNVETHIVPMKCNYKYLKSIFGMCYSLGVSKVSILRLVLQGRALENMPLVKLTGTEEINISTLINELKILHNGKVRIGLPYSNRDCKIFCKAATEKINIRYDGNVYPCEVFKDDLMNQMLGCQPDNVLRIPFLKIYKESPYLNTVRKSIEVFKMEDSIETCFGQQKIK